MRDICLVRYVLWLGRIFSSFSLELIDDTVLWVTFIYYNCVKYFFFAKLSRRTKKETANATWRRYVALQV